MNIVVLTGAGVSAESGLGTFRDAAGEGLWARFDPMKLATPEAFAADPDLVQSFYNARRAAMRAASPNAAHAALARLEEAWGDRLTLVTQNIDDLHERAGSRRVLHMHGRLLEVRCTACGTVREWPGDVGRSDACPACGSRGTLRPNVVWFGEMPFHLEEIDDALARADLFVAMGTSGSVYPAAGFVDVARRRGVRTCELNLEPSDTARRFHEARYGPASVVVPGFVEDLLRT